MIELRVLAVDCDHLAAAAPARRCCSRRPYRRRQLEEPFEVRLRSARVAADLGGAVRLPLLRRDDRSSCAGLIGLERRSFLALMLSWRRLAGRSTGVIVAMS